jgi:hypothetical protein
LKKKNKTSRVKCPRRNSPRVSSRRSRINRRRRLRKPLPKKLPPPVVFKLRQKTLPLQLKVLRARKERKLALVL